MDPSATADKKAFHRGLFGAVFFHAVLISVALIATSADSSYRTLAVYEYDVYDPLGGEPGGGLDSIAEETPAPEPVQEEVQEPEPEPEPDPEPVSFVESVSERAEPIAPPPPPEEPKEKPKPKPQPQAQPRPQASGPAPMGTPDGTPGLPGGGPGTGQGGVGGGTGKGTRDAREAYKAQVRRKLERNKKYPPRARSDHMEGTATVRFTITRDGQVVDFSLVRASGIPLLDDEVQALLRRVNPFPQFPPELTEPSMTLTAPIQFKIR
jgi:protein TonB